MKKFYLTCMAVIAMAATAYAANPLVIREKGNDTTVAVDQVQRITFAADGSVNVYCTDSRVITIPAADFVSLRFNTDMNGVTAAVSGGDAQLTVCGGVITSTTAGIAVYDMTGTAVASSSSDSLATSEIPAGVYIIKSGTTTLKVAVK